MKQRSRADDSIDEQVDRSLCSGLAADLEDDVHYIFFTNSILLDIQPSSGSMIIPEHRLSQRLPLNVINLNM